MKETKVKFPFQLLRFWFRRNFLLWFIAGFFIFIVQILVCNIARDNEKLRLMMNLLDTLPAFMKNAIGGDLLSIGNIGGFIAIGYQHPLVLIAFMTFAISISTGLLTGQVQNGMMELILSRSVTKNHVYVCACFLTLAGMLALVLVMFSGTVIGVNICHLNDQVNLQPFFRACIVGGLLSGTAAGVSLLAAVSFRSRGTAVGIALAFFVVNYFIDVISGWWPKAEFLGPFSIFYYVSPQRILHGPGWPVSDMCVLMSIILVTVIAGAIVWNRRDLPL